MTLIDRDWAPRAIHFLSNMAFRSRRSRARQVVPTFGPVETGSHRRALGGAGRSDIDAEIGETRAALVRCHRFDGKRRRFGAGRNVVVRPHDLGRVDEWAIDDVTYDREMDQICNDLHAEHEALDAVVADISEEMWAADTPAEGWDVRATIVHLIQADMAASLAVTDPDEFTKAKEAMLSGSGTLSYFESGNGLSGAETLALWRSERDKMLAAFRSREPKDRIPWFGPDMSTLSFATARLMETWSHGQDVADTVGAPWPATDRIKHVCHIGVTTRGWSYMVRGREVPTEPVRVELTSPSGELWTWGPEDAANRITGSAEEFCLVATQRRQPSSTSLVTEGDLAAEWLGIAQAFAGEATLPDTR